MERSRKPGSDVIAQPRPHTPTSGAHPTAGRRPDPAHSRAVAGLCLCTALLIQAGCASRSPRPDPSRGPVSTPVGTVSDTGWPFWPSDMRIHPLTQFVNDRKTGELVIEARVEFIDPYGHTCKAFGQIELALHDADPEQFNANPAGTWPEDLTDLELNQIYFDDVTGTYLLRLEISEIIEVPQQAQLRAAFQPADGRRLQATRSSAIH